jgi:CBS domain-containing protein
MTTPVITVLEGARISEVERLLERRGISSLAVVGDDGRAVGVLSRTDVLRAARAEVTTNGPTVRESLHALRARDIMHRDVFSVAPSTSVAVAARAMVSRRFHRVFVAEGPRLVGVFSTKDVLRAIAEKRVGTPIGTVMSAPAFTVRVSDPLWLATDRLEQAHVSGLCVVDEDEWPVGTFTQSEALAAIDRPSATPVEEVMSYSVLCLDVHTPLFRAAAQAQATRSRRVLAVEGRRAHGVVTGLDFARAASAG